MVAIGHDSPDYVQTPVLSLLKSKSGSDLRHAGDQRQGHHEAAWRQNPVQGATAKKKGGSRRPF